MTSGTINDVKKKCMAQMAKVAETAKIANTDMQKFE